MLFHGQSPGTNVHFCNRGIQLWFREREDIVHIGLADLCDRHCQRWVDRAGSLPGLEVSLKSNVCSWTKKVITQSTPDWNANREGVHTKVAERSFMPMKCWAFSEKTATCSSLQWLACCLVNRNAAVDLHLSTQDGICLLTPMPLSQWSYQIWSILSSRTILESWILQVVVHLFIFGWFPQDRLPKCRLLGHRIWPYWGFGSVSPIGFFLSRISTSIAFSIVCVGKPISRHTHQHCPWSHWEVFVYLLGAKSAILFYLACPCDSDSTCFQTFPGDFNSSFGELSDKFLCSFFNVVFFLTDLYI